MSQLPIYVPEVVELAAEPDPYLEFRWGTVTSTDPLRVRIDGDKVPLPIEPKSLVPPSYLEVGRRVWVQFYGRRLYLLGQVGDPPPPSPPPSLPVFDPVLLLSGSATTTSASWVDAGTTKSFELPLACYCSVSFKGLPLGGSTNTTIRVRLVWSGATAGDSYSYHGNNWSGCLSGMANTARDDASVNFGLVLNEGTTTFKLQIMRESGTATANIADVGLNVMPIRAV